ncbi:MAG: hypothetical protein ACRBN8_30260 [Nannocystales bacterium]
MLQLPPVSRLLPSILLLASTACDESSAPSETEAEDDSVFRALTTAEGEYFDVETRPVGPVGTALRSTGHLIVRLVGTAATGPANPPTEDDISGTCGVTFVSPTIAVTAGHCLPGLSELDEVEVRTPRVEAGFVPDPTISGVFPAYNHTDAPGHSYDRYICKVRSRCYSGETPINCDITPSDISVPLSMSALDIGILDCDPVDGARHDYVNVADSVANSDGVALPWYHELYEPPLAEPSASDFEEHYVQKLAYASNYHYIGAGERHQMLPLLSTDYDGDRWRVVSPPTGVVISTNLRGCHGTSGSGVMRKDDELTPELLGPVTTGHGSISGNLCHVAGADSDSATTIRTMHPEVTQYFVDKYIPASCSDAAVFSTRLAYWLACDRFAGDLQYDPYWRFRPGVCPSCVGFSRLDLTTTLALRFDAVTPKNLVLKPREIGQRYRASVRVWANKFPTTVELRMGGTIVAKHIFTGQDEDWVGNDASKVLSASFIADGATSGPMTVAMVDGSTTQELAVSQVLLVPDGASGAFDTMHNRMSYGVLDVQNLKADVRPVVFNDSGAGGFAATLKPEQRLVATGLALVPGRSWHVGLSGDSGDLTCGLMFADGSETQVPCATNDGGVTLDGTGQDAPIALFVQTDGNAPSVTVLSDLVVKEVVACVTDHPTCEAGGALEAGCDPCVMAICDADPYCCDNAWDSVCVGQVLSVCDQVQCDASLGSCKHSVCTAGDNLPAGCDTPVSPSCTSAICNADPYCCDTAWDSVCVAAVGSVCGLRCG